MHTLILLRHGQSKFNQQKIFTGWLDPDLSELGRREAKQAAIELKAEGLHPDIAFTSTLVRGIRTLWYVLDDMDRMWIPVQRSWRLNERHYGALQGKSKVKVKNEVGEEKLLEWRRSWDVRPPKLAPDDPRHAKFDERYASIPAKEVPNGECLRDVWDRVEPYWLNAIVPQLQAGKTVIVSAHGNSLRALVQHLDQMPHDEVMDLNIPTGIPLVYELDEQMHPLSKRYLGDEDALKKRLERVHNETSAEK